DLIYGGVVGNLQTPYLVTYKADGIRKLLFIDREKGIWLIYPNYEFNLLFLVSQAPEICKNFSGTILDGELIMNSKTSKYQYLIFDCISFNGNIGVQDYPYISETETARHTIFSQLAKIINFKENILRVDIKESAILKNPEVFFSEINRFLDRRELLSYPQDGLMFIPVDVEYNPHSEKHQLYERRLTKYPDTVKWKPPIEITIDFAIKKVSHDKVSLYSWEHVSKKYVPFKGTKMF
ncbi:mRNA capping enzyme domain protein, partial [mine drainage metagenome]